MSASDVKYVVNVTVITDPSEGGDESATKDVHQRTAHKEENIHLIH